MESEKSTSFMVANRYSIENSKHRESAREKMRDKKDTHGESYFEHIVDCNASMHGKCTMIDKLSFFWSWQNSCVEK